MSNLFPSSRLGKPGRKGLYPARGCDDDGCGAIADFLIESDILTKTIQLEDLSDPTPGHTIDSWFWDFGDSHTSTEQEPSHTYTGNGPFTITLTIVDSLGCEDEKQASISFGAIDCAQLIFPDQIKLTIAGLGNSQLAGHTCDSCIQTNGVHILPRVGMPTPGFASYEIDSGCSEGGIGASLTCDVFGGGIRPNHRLEIVTRGAPSFQTGGPTSQYDLIAYVDLDSFTTGPQPLGDDRHPVHCQDEGATATISSV